MNLWLPLAFCSCVAALVSGGGESTAGGGGGGARVHVGVSLRPRRPDRLRASAASDGSVTTFRRAVPPLVFAAAPCSGSTAVQTIARAMLGAHGHEADGWLHWEEFRAAKNSHVKRYGGGLHDAIEAQIASARQRGKVFFNKLEPYTDERTMRMLVEQGARVVNVWRSNALDFAACSVRDCFIRWLGYPVLANGTGSNLCFNRRAMKEPTMAYVYHKGLAKSLRNFLHTGSWQLAQLRRMGFRGFKTVSTEALLGFEASHDNLERSVSSWGHFLLSLGMVPHRATIVQVLNGGCGKVCTVGGRPYKPHSEVIYNIDDVREELLNSTDPRIRDGLLRL